MKEMKTGYDWCLETNMRILDLPEDSERVYYTVSVDKDTFMEFISQFKVKPNSTPRKTTMYLEYRMYGLVPYNISPIQAAIQYGHGVVEYQQNCRGMSNFEHIYNKWAREDKTFIILNGGTTNDDLGHKFYGSMQKFRDELIALDGVSYAEFREPDLNNALTAITFLVDERVFNRELYPDYVDDAYPWKDKGRGYRPTDKEMDKWEVANIKNRDRWVEKIGGASNDWLRSNLRQMRLANN